MHVHTHMCNGTHVKVRGLLEKVTSSLPSCGFPGVKFSLRDLTAGAVTHRVTHNCQFFTSILINFLLSLYINIQPHP